MRLISRLVNIILWFSYPERLKVSNPAPLHNKKNDATDDGDSQTADMLLCID
ncbi:hypothetical protein T4E_10111 [Trichinella pseudospiralis]|uniref:Uncharacterized protein n=1 Tax=Trichinella pseudospiralis TaxID=6337 RepID=A0A0V0YHX5_TRIPS|nr:hypothetical protein T4E_10111 [Trichinella pseudospiralis]